jgi:hypothetical protein
MAPSFSYGRKGRQYRYYVSASVLPGRRAAPSGKDATHRVSAAGLENLVRDRLTLLCCAFEPLSWEAITAIVQRVELYGHSIQLECSASALAEPHEQLDAFLQRLAERVPEDRIVASDGAVVRLICDRRPRFRGGKADSDQGLENSAEDPDLLAKLRTAHQLLEEHSMSPMSENSHSSASAPQWQRQRRLMTLGLLAPALQKKIATGSCTARTLDEIVKIGLPLAWSDQADWLADR